MPRTSIIIDVDDGHIDGNFFTPEGAGPWPAIIYYMDGLGIRPASFEMAERLAANGFAVLQPNLFYRFGPIGAVDRGKAGERTMSLVQSVTNAAVMAETKAFLAFLDSQPAVKGPKVGTVGYCMGGSLALTAAAAFPGRVAAAASIHGARLAIDTPDSPHLRAGEMKGEVYVGVSEIDPWLVEGETDRLDAALKAAGTNYKLEIYPGVVHGFAPPGGERYDREASERHWDRLLALFKRNLG